MLLPIGDQPNDSRRVPWMNYAIIGLNGVVFVLIWASARTPEAFQGLLFTWGYTPAEPRLVTIFSGMFLHGGWMHLLGNMLFLWIFGDNIEARLGPLGYLLAYLGVGVAATLVYGAFNSGSEIPVVGASGAISGVQGLYFIACPKHKVKVFIWFYFYISVVYVSARLIMGFWFVLQDLLPVVLSDGPTPGGDDGVAHLAHLGGFAAGLVLMLILERFIRRSDEVPAADSTRASLYQGASKDRYRPSRPRRDPYRPRQ
jgi:membrane associated rhomboid family serine protease